MATRLPESSLVESRISLEPSKCKQSFMISKKLSDVSVEEKESCGSNEVSVSFDSFPVGAAKEKDGHKPTGYRLKATRSVSKRKTAVSYQCAKGYTKVGISFQSSIQNSQMRQILLFPFLNFGVRYVRLDRIITGLTC